MLTHPKKNRFMVVESISGLNLDFFDVIYFVVLQEHEDQYQFTKGMARELKELGVLDKSKFAYLTEPTSSQSDTVYQVLSGDDVEGFVFVKDSDNYYECNIEEGNQVAYYDLNAEDDINARNKSYIELDVNGVITNIVEKDVISSTFSCGGYGFADAKEFCKSYEKLEVMEGECYISNVIYDMMLSGSKFSGSRVDKYKDWGTLEVWNKYKSQYNTLFVDIDGTLVTNSSIQFPPYVGSGEPLTLNIQYLREEYEQGKVYIILTTSRPEFLRETTVKEMERHNMPYDQLVMGLPHCKRTVINDFAKSNTYPSCDAINIPRNHDNLSEYL
tara:strand:- start:10004 stop:10990 length:987 start_codon:yes stop_codon:yes gene_type:complete